MLLVLWLHLGDPLAVLAPAWSAFRR
jgi:hypothetical protein